MFNWILRKVIGGDTGKRELALLILLLWFLHCVMLTVLDVIDIEADTILSMWQVFTPFCFAMVAGAFGLEWYSFQNRDRDRGSPP